MKKLIVAVAIVCAAVVSQAASVYWTCTDVMAGNETDEISGIAYFLTTDMLSYTDAQGLVGKGAAAITEALGSAYSFTGSGSAFSVKTANAVANETLGLQDSKDYSAYLMIFDSNSITDDSKFYLTDTKSFTTLAGADDAVKVSWGSQFDNTSVPGSWNSAASVPEPTSGLLLILGVAGLALRRKQK